MLLAKGSTSALPNGEFNFEHVLSRAFSLVQLETSQPIVCPSSLSSCHGNKRCKGEHGKLRYIFPMYEAGGTLKVSG